MPNGYENRFVAYCDLLGTKARIQESEFIPILNTYRQAILVIKRQLDVYADQIGGAWFSDSFLLYAKNSSINGYLVESALRLFLYKC